jgi:probable rRNA maturation factor
MKLTTHNPHSYSAPSPSHYDKIVELIDLEIGLLPGQLNLIFCDDEKIQELNRDYRKKDKVTDVLSFPYFDGETDEQDLIGEIFISYPQTLRQATSEDLSNTILDQHKAEEMEVYKLVIHGVLHIRGYDHIDDEDFRVMKLLEDKIMESFLESQKS